MDEQSQSPVPKEAEVERVIEVGMDFPSAMREVLDGKKITRKEWEDKDSYGVLENEFLMIKNKGMHQWLVSETDLKSEDWVVIE